MTTPLEELGSPLAYEVDEHEVGAFDAPPVRLGQAQRTRVRSLSASGMQKEALVTNTLSGTTWRLASDEGEYLDGADVAPAPLAFMTTGMVSSFASELLALADARDIDVEDLTLTQDNYYTMTGSALRGTMTGGALPVEVRADIDADADDATLRDLVETATVTSPVYGLMCNSHESVFTLVVNGEDIAPGDVAELDGPTLPDPREAFERLGHDADGGDPPHIVRTGRETDPLPEGDPAYTSGKASSLAEEQDRVLHLRGVCTLREDGLKDVEVHLFSPLGTVFEFRSDEPAGYGGRGRAPSATTYLAAGIGFCFMTQLGRYADILETDLSGYRTVQDTHFSLGGGVSGTEAPGEAAPVETHTFLETPAGVAFARDALAMGEQTCFLHALCRTDLDAPSVELSSR